MLFWPLIAIGVSVPPLRRARLAQLEPPMRVTYSSGATSTGRRAHCDRYGPTESPTLRILCRLPPTHVKYMETPAPFCTSSSTLPEGAIDQFEIPVTVSMPAGRSPTVRTVCRDPSAFW